MKDRRIPNCSTLILHKEKFFLSRFVVFFRDITLSAVKALIIDGMQSADDQTPIKN